MLSILMGSVFIYFWWTIKKLNEQDARWKKLEEDYLAKQEARRKGTVSRLPASLEAPTVVTPRKVQLPKKVITKGNIGTPITKPPSPSPTPHQR